MKEKRDSQGRFKKGVSGNPEGRPKGARHVSTVAALNLIEGETEAITRKAIEMALEGDTTALRLCMERLVPAAKERPLAPLELPEISCAGDVLSALGKVATQLGNGQLLPSEAIAVSNILDQYRKHHEALELEGRIDKLEEIVHGKR